FHRDDHRAADLRAEGFEGEEEEVVGKGAGRGFAAHGGVDRCADGEVDVEDDRLLAVAEEDRAAGGGGQQGDGLDTDEIGHEAFIAAAALVSKIKAAMLGARACARSSTSTWTASTRR